MEAKNNRRFSKIYLLCELLIFALVVVVNLCQYFNYINTTVFGRTYTFGFPFTIYEFDLMFNRGFINLEGVLGNFVLVIVLGYVLGALIQYFNKNNSLK